MPDLQQVRQYLQGDTGRLAATYLAIIMGLTLMFSGLIYAIGASQFERPLQSRGGPMSQFDDFTRSSFELLLEQRAAQARQELLASLVLLNLAVLLGGAFFSYFLARKTLEPIETAMHSQARFVSDASHELRTPLTALQVTNEVALRKKKLTLAQAKELIGHNLAETIKLRSLSESLLGLTQQGAVDITSAPINLSECVLDAVQTLSPLAADQRVTIGHDVPSVELAADAAAVTQIVRILLDNAIKYSPPGSAVAITARQDGPATVVSVRDHGPGIAPEHQAKIFDRFYRIDQSRSSQNVPGSGLGLAIAQTIAGRHGYRLAVDSAPGKGATFSLTI